MNPTVERLDELWVVRLEVEVFPDLSFMDLVAQAGPSTDTSSEIYDIENQCPIVRSGRMPMALITHAQATSTREFEAMVAEFAKTEGMTGAADPFTGLHLGYRYPCLARELRFKYLGVAHFGGQPVLINDRRHVPYSFYGTNRLSCRLRWAKVSWEGPDWASVVGEPV